MRKIFNLGFSFINSYSWLYADSGVFFALATSYSNAAYPTRTFVLHIGEKYLSFEICYDMKKYATFLERMKIQKAKTEARRAAYFKRKNGETDAKSDD